MSHPLIDQPDAAQAALAALDRRRPLALDTEFMREKTYFPQLALVQVADADGRLLLLDPAAPAMAPTLAGLVGEASALMHSASEDLVAFRHALGVLPKRLFDTQIAAAFAGLGPGLGYQALVKTLLGVDLAKAETRSDWLRRPLSPQQLDYAADDVRHLHEAVDALLEKLESRGQRERAEADMARMLESARDEREDPNPHLALRPAAALDRPAQARLRNLLRWREAAARRKDLPKRWLIDNDLAITLARRPPGSAQALDALLEDARAARKLRDEIADVLARPLDDEDARMPLAKEPERLDRARLKALQAVVAREAAALDLPEGLLCARRHLESLLADGEWPAGLEGWRRDVLEAPLRQALA